VVAGADGNAMVIAGGLAPGQTVVTAGVHTLTPGRRCKLYSGRSARRERGARSAPPPAAAAAEPRPPAAERGGHATAMTSRHRPPSRFNISRWALEHPALTRYLMVVLLVLGVAAYFQLGQDEDPPFTFRAMVVQAFWPGASAQQMAEQVTDKIEKTLQEVPHADKIRSYTKPGESLTILQLKDSSPPKRCPTAGTRRASASATCATRCRRA
jgi:hypothetical protein